MTKGKARKAYRKIVCIKKKKGLPKRFTKPSEVIMTKKNFFVGMLAIALTLGLVLAGCENDGVSNQFVGTWKATTTEARLIFNDDLTWSYSATKASGTYSPAENTASLQSSNASAFNGAVVTIRDGILTSNIILISLLKFTKES